MKKTFVILIALMTVSSVHAQLRSGRMLLGGSIGFSQSNNTTKDSTGFDVLDIQNTSLSASIRYGYFITDHFAIGVLGGYSGQSYDYKSHGVNPISTSENKQNTNNYSGGVFARYYQMLGKSRFAVFGQISTSYGRGTTKYNDIYSSAITNPVTLQDNYSKQLTVSASIIPGLTYFINDYFSVEATIGSLAYNLTDTKNYVKRAYGDIKAGDQKNSNTSLSLSLSSIFLGFNFYFGGGKAPATQPVKN